MSFLIKPNPLAYEYKNSLSKLNIDERFPSQTAGEAELHSSFDWIIYNLPKLCCKQVSEAMRSNPATKVI